MEGDVALLKQMKIIKKGRNDANTELPNTLGGGGSGIKQHCRDVQGIL